MHNEKVVYLTERREKQAPLEYAVLFRHQGKDEVSFRLFGGMLRRQDRELVADALEAAAKELRAPS